MQLYARNSCVIAVRLNGFVLVDTYLPLNVLAAGGSLQMRKPGTSFADKDSVQRLAGDALQGLLHITTFNLPQVN